AEPDASPLPAERAAAKAGRELTAPPWSAAKLAGPPFPLSTLGRWCLHWWWRRRPGILSFWSFRVPTGFVLRRTRKLRRVRNLLGERLCTCTHVCLLANFTCF